MMLKWYIDNNLYTPSQGAKALYKMCEYSANETYNYLINNVEILEDIKSNNYNNSGKSLLHIVCNASETNDNWNGSKSIFIIEDLINGRGIPVDIKDKTGKNCLYYAVSSQSSNIVKYLIEKYNIKVTSDELNASIEPRLCNSKFKLYIHKMINKKYNIKSIEIIRQYCSKGPKFIFGNFPVDYHTVEQNLEIIKNAIHNLEKEDYVEAMELLSTNGIHDCINLINIDIKEGLLTKICSSDYLMTPIRVSSWLGSWLYPFDNVIECILKKEVNVNEEINGQTPLHILCNNPNSTIKQIELLIEYGANIDAIDKFGHNPLFYAKKNNYKSIVELLIREGAI